MTPHCNSTRTSKPRCKSYSRERRKWAERLNESAALIGQASGFSARCQPDRERSPFAATSQAVRSDRFTDAQRRKQVLQLFAFLHCCEPRRLSGLAVRE